jgi:thiosulfate dehydrogenase [quinone] large subunit
MDASQRKGDLIMNEIRRSTLACAALMVRVTLGVIFFFYGLEKFLMGLGNFAGYIDQQFAQSWLPAFSLAIFSHVLPFCEITIGALLIAGLFTRVVLILMLALLIMLSYGQVIIGHAEIVAHNLIYTAVGALALLLSDFDRISLDGALFRRGVSGRE